MLKVEVEDMKMLKNHREDELMIKIEMLKKEISEKIEIIEYL